MATTDYRELCLELFGTDDVQKLRRIAANIPNNSRNAGRKKKFGQLDIEDMKAMLAEGMSMEQIAQKYQTSRQVVNKYLNPPLAAPYTARLCYMYRQQICTTIDVDFLHEQINIQNRTGDMLHRAFGVNETPDWNAFQAFLQERCFPPSRGFLKQHLMDLGLDSYDPLQIIEKTGGRTAEDNLWIKVEYRELAG